MLYILQTHTHICIIARMMSACSSYNQCRTCQGLEYILNLRDNSESISGRCRTHILAYIPEVSDTKPKQNKPVNVII